MINKRYHILFIFSMLLIVSTLSFGQQDPMFTQYMNNPVTINPAYAGSRGDININSVFRKQWTGFPGAPTTTTLTGHGAFFNNTVGLGVDFINDRIGPVQQTGMYVDYAYLLRIDATSNLSLGLKGGFNYYDVNLYNQTSDEYDSHIALYGRRTMFLPNFGIGVYYYRQNMFIGASLPKLIRNSLYASDNTNQVVGKLERHFFLMGGVVFDIDPVVKFKPSSTIRLVRGAPSSIDFTATFIFFDRFWVGGMYRVGDSFAGHARFQVNDRLQLGYSYDYTNSRLRAYNTGTHEIFVSYDFAFRGKKILSPRYF